MTKKAQSVPVVIEPDPNPEPEHYRVKSWRGYPLYECKHCPYDTIESEATIKAHYDQKHAPPPDPVPGSSGLILIADKRGNVVEVEPGHPEYELDDKDLEDFQK